MTGGRRCTKLPDATTLAVRGGCDFSDLPVRSPGGIRRRGSSFCLRVVFRLTRGGDALCSSVSARRDLRGPRRLDGVNLGSAQVIVEEVWPHPPPLASCSPVGPAQARGRGGGLGSLPAPRRWTCASRSWPRPTGISLLVCLTRPTLNRDHRAHPVSRVPNHLAAHLVGSSMVVCAVQYVLHYPHAEGIWAVGWACLL